MEHDGYADYYDQLDVVITMMFINANQVFGSL